MIRDTSLSMRFFRQQYPHIYAVGDVIGGPCLASTSMEQGRLAARHACGAQTHHFPTFYPIGIYTIPEISSCGYTEEELKELGFITKWDGPITMK